LTIAGALLLAADLVLVASALPPETPAQFDIRLGKKYCPIVTAARAIGLTDDQIIAMAVARGISPGMIIWAKKNCIVAQPASPAIGPRSSLQEVVST